MGVPFNRTPEGLLDFRRFGGTRTTAPRSPARRRASSSLYALDEQVRRWEARGHASRKFERQEFLGVVLDDAGTLPRARRAWTSTTMEIQRLPGDAVMLAPAGPARSSARARTR